MNLSSVVNICHRSWFQESPIRLCKFHQSDLEFTLQQVALLAAKPAAVYGGCLSRGFCKGLAPPSALCNGLGLQQEMLLKINGTTLGVGKGQLRYSERTHQESAIRLRCPLAHTTLHAQRFNFPGYKWCQWTLKKI